MNPYIKKGKDYNLLNFIANIPEFYCLEEDFGNMTMALIF